MANLTAFSKWMFAQSLLIVSGVSTVKISVGLSLARLWRKTKYVKFLWAVIIFTVLFCLACLGTLIFQCLPVRAAWDFSLRPPPLGTGNANCYSISTFRNIGMFNSVVNILTDVLFATMPIPLVWQLQLNTRTKLSLIAILSLGYFASAAAVIKTINQWKFFDEKDWSVHDTFNVWNVIELDVGIVAACLPSLKPLFNWALETARAITTGSGNRRTGNRYGYGYSSNKRSSIGYVKQADSSIMAMDDLGRSGKTEFTSHISSTNASGKSRDPHDPYNVRMSAGQHGAGDAEAWNWSEGNAKNGGSTSATTTATRTGGSSPSSWDHEARKKSDDHILPLQNFPPRGGKGGIVRTTEVTVS